MHSVPCSFLVKVGKRARGRLDICPKKATTAVLEAKIHAKSAQFATFERIVIKYINIVRIANAVML